jgi:hypothetical protein
MLHDPVAMSDLSNLIFAIAILISAIWPNGVFK